MVMKLSTKKAHEGDVVELLEEFPEYGLHQGQRGVVITVFEEPQEAYDVEVQGEDGAFLGFAYSVKPTQFANITDDFIEEGLTFVLDGNDIEAEKRFKVAAALNPKSKGIVLNSILKIADQLKEKERIIPILRLLCRAFPDYEYARNNLAIAYLNYAVKRAKVDDFGTAQMYLLRAIGMNAPTDVVIKIQENLASVLIALGEHAHAGGRFEESMALMRTACATYPSDATRHNLRLAHAHLARFYMGERRYQDAVLAFEAAEEAGLVLPELLNDHAITLVFEGRVEEAAHLLGKALELAPEAQKIKENLEKLRSNQSSETLIPETIRTNYIPIPAMDQGYQLAS